jgi:SAM-dependent methyltransferase
MGMIRRSCPVCGRDGELMPLLEINGIPVFCNVLYPRREQALKAERADIQLFFCGHCGHVFNSAFDPAKTEYSPNYENSLHYSTKFQGYAEKLAADLVERYDLKGKTIVEIGCGKGDFLNLLCRMGENRGTGFDTSYEEDRIADTDRRRFTVIRDYYSEKYTDIRADIVVCRHVLEHISAPREFLSALRRTVGGCDRTVFFFEVPNVMYTLKDLGIWDLIYEHCGYFSRPSLAYLFKTCGFAPVRINTAFEGQYLCLEAFSASENDPSAKEDAVLLTEVTGCAKAFAQQYRKKVAEWAERLEALNGQGLTAVAWGAGSKGVTFLNVLKSGGAIDYVVDINPHKQGLFVPGAAQKVVAPESLRTLKPDAVLVMNPVYSGEIREFLSAMNLTSELISV